MFSSEIFWFVIGLTAKPFSKTLPSDRPDMGNGFVTTIDSSVDRNDINGHDQNIRFE